MIKGLYQNSKLVVFSLGLVILFEIQREKFNEVCEDQKDGYLPFNESEIFLLKYLEDFSRLVSPKFFGIVSRMLNYNPELRPSIQEIYEKLGLNSQKKEENITRPGIDRKSKQGKLSER